MADRRGTSRIRQFFTSVNLVEIADTRTHGRFDVIFCRNVLIYFDDASRRLAAENLYDNLVPGGFICLGHAETMSRISPLFDARRYTDAIVYQRPGRAARGRRPQDGFDGRRWRARARVLSRDLEAAGFRVEEALNGIEALETLLVTEMDLLVVDMNMPQMDGLTFLGFYGKRTVRWPPFPRS